MYVCNLQTKTWRLTKLSFIVKCAKNCVDMCARHGWSAIEICLSEKGALAKKIGKHWFRVYVFKCRVRVFLLGLGFGFQF